MEKFYKVYMYVNKIDDKKYIGITSMIPEKRWANGHGYKHNLYFWRAIKKYGWDNFEHIVLFDHLTKEEAENIEIELIDFYNTTDPKFGYNIEKGGNLNKDIPESSRIKMSNSQKKVDRTGKNNPMNKISEETRKRFVKMNTGKNNPMYGKGRKVICLETLEIFNNIRECSEKFNIDNSSISSVCRGKLKTTGGLHFCYLEDYDENKKYDLNKSHNIPKKIICLNNDMVFNSIGEASRFFNIRTTSISAVCRGKNHTAYGYRFEYYNNER